MAIVASMSAQVTSAGISAPSYQDILDTLISLFQSIYGSDVYVAADSQDGQWLATLATAINDQNQAMIATYNAFRPTGAVGVGLSSIVKINGIHRQEATFSTAVGNVVGQSGTTILNGVVQDNNGNQWDLPPSVTIPPGGTIAVTVTAAQPGAVAAPAGSINQIASPTRGWQSFVSTSDAVAGVPVESDATLRKRQSQSTSLPSNTPLGGVLSALANLDGVTRARVYENSTDSVDLNGIPARSISAVVEGGDVGEIAETIGQKKTPGAATYGNTTEPYIDPNTGINYDIEFFVLAEQAVSVEITITAGAAYSSTIESSIQQVVAEYINSLGIGVPVQFSRLWAPAYLNGSDDGQTYEITAMTLDGAGLDVTIPFNKAASCDPSNVVITVSP